MGQPEVSELEHDICQVLNKHSAEVKSSTPDFVLAEYLVRCLEAFDVTLANRMNYYGKSP